ncbi:hypothetical protein GCM10029992_59610 [Glycomyces albus]
MLLAARSRVTEVLYAQLTAPEPEPARRVHTLGGMTRDRGSETTETDGVGQDLAPLGQRFTALLIDWISCLVLGYTLSALTPLGDVTAHPVANNISIATLFILYRTIALGFGSQTLGMAVMRIACVSARHGDGLSLGSALIRSILESIVLPALTALADPYHRGLHDRASGSVMLKVMNRP